MRNLLSRVYNIHSTRAAPHFLTRITKKHINRKDYSAAVSRCGLKSSRFISLCIKNCFSPNKYFKFMFCLQFN